MQTGSLLVSPATKNLQVLLRSPVRSRDGAKPRQENYQSIHFETAEELLHELSPIPLLETQTTNPKFVFRGECDAQWPPTPSALRTNGEKKTKAIELVGTLDGKADNQILAEFLLLDRFLKACDDAAIALPGDSIEYRTRYMGFDGKEINQIFKDPSKWPYQAQLPLLATAQHHGVPTRLLDWTRNAIIAAYFAAADVLKKSKNERPEKFQVWALNTEYIHLYEQVEMVPLPGANNPRLGAQQGLFTLLRERAGRGRPTTLNSLADVLVSPNEGSSPKPLWKLTLPCSEAGPMLYLCHLYGVDAARMYPGMEGAALATLESLEWHRRDTSTADPTPAETVASRRRQGIKS